MAYFKQVLFGGIAPAVDPTILADGYGQVAENVELVSGKIEPAPQDQPVSSSLKTNTISTVFNYNPPNQDYITNYSATQWLQFTYKADVVYGPVPADSLGRIYWSGGSYPAISWNAKILASETDTGGTYAATATYPRVYYRLGVPAPKASGPLLLAPVYVSGETGPPPGEASKEVAYALTYVTFDGREGPPLYSGVTSENSNVDHINITHVRQFNASTTEYLDGLTTAHHIQKLRIYKSNTGSQDTQYQFLGEYDINANAGTTPTYYLGEVVHNLRVFEDDLTTALGEVIPSATWVGPPDDDTSLYPDGALQGLTNIAQGVFAGFSGKRFCLSEPFMPHAWPVQYRITIERDVVAIATTQGGIVALTEGQPYFITGTDPTVMAASKIDFAQPCINSDSVVNLDDLVIYASREGLCAISGTQGEVITKNLITTKQWVGSYNPESYKAFMYEGKYVAFWAEGQSCKGFLYDPDSETARLTTLNRGQTNLVLAGYTEPSTGDLFLAKSGATNAQMVNFRKNTFNIDGVSFKTKTVKLPKPGSMSWLSVDAGFPFNVKVYADGVNVAHYYFAKSGDDITQTVTVPSGINGAHNVYNTTVRLPAVVASEWEVEVYNTGGASSSREGHIHEICISETLEELKST